MAILSNSEKGMNAKKLAAITRFSVNHLSKILTILKRNDFLKSVRGPYGGFAIAKNPSEISLYEIYKVIEGELKSFQCSITCENCYFENCLFGKQPHEFNDNFRVYLETHTLEDVRLNKTTIKEKN
jgi:Rrf2 family protein